MITHQASPTNTNLDTGCRLDSPIEIESDLAIQDSEITIYDIKKNTIVNPLVTKIVSHYNSTKSTARALKLLTSLAAS